MAKITKVTVDDAELKKLGKDIVRANRIMIGRLAEKGRILLREEVPVRTGNLKREGVQAPVVDYERLRAELTVSATQDARTGTTAEVFNEKGERVKTVTLRPSPAYNYAEVVARGNKKPPRLHPKNAKAWLIPVAGKPDKGGYLIAGGQIFIVRKFKKKGQEANPYDERAGRRLEAAAPGIADQVLAQFV